MFCFWLAFTNLHVKSKPLRAEDREMYVGFKNRLRNFPLALWAARRAGSVVTSLSPQSSLFLPTAPWNLTLRLHILSENLYEKVALFCAFPGTRGDGACAVPSETRDE